MTTGGWFMLCFVIGGVTGLLIWCVWKVVSTPGSASHLHSPADIDPLDD